MNTDLAEGFKKIKPYIYKIMTPSGYGTGFQLFYSTSSKLCGIATAYHVISHEHNWEEPIKLVHFQTKKSVMLKQADRAVIAFPDNDLAFIVFVGNETNKLESLSLVPKGRSVFPGIEIGWCGFPNIVSEELCFFRGVVSSYLIKETTYLVDGVAINGVSGGPTFVYVPNENKLYLCGVISAYMPNRATGESLPGISFISSVDPYQNMLENMRSMEEAHQKAGEQSNDIGVSVL